ncbi:MAG: hypothetical protein R2698_01055 [Microthrixaceae bacterium]
MTGVRVAVAVEVPGAGAPTEVGDVVVAIRADALVGDLVDAIADRLVGVEERRGWALVERIDPADGARSW